MSEKACEMLFFLGYLYRSPNVHRVLKDTILFTSLIGIRKIVFGSDTWLRRLLYRNLNVKVISSYRKVLITYGFQNSIFFFAGVLPFEDQHEITRNERKMEVQINQQAFIWGNEEKYIDLPGYTKAQVHEDLPRRVQFTDVAQKTFKAGRKAGLLNLGLTRWAHKMRVLEEKESSPSPSSSSFSL